VAAEAATLTQAHKHTSTLPPCHTTTHTPVHRHDITRSTTHAAATQQPLQLPHQPGCLRVKQQQVTRHIRRWPSPRLYEVGAAGAGGGGVALGVSEGGGGGGGEVWEGRGLWLWFVVCGLWFVVCGLRFCARNHAPLQRARRVMQTQRQGVIPAAVQHLSHASLQAEISFVFEVEISFVFEVEISFAFETEIGFEVGCGAVPAPPSLAAAASTRARVRGRKRRNDRCLRDV